MDEKKKSSKNKKTINIKNRKEATRVLNKTSQTNKKNVTKNKTKKAKKVVKKVPIKELKNSIEKKETLLKKEPLDKNIKINKSRLKEEDEKHLSDKKTLSEDSKPKREKQSVSKNSINNKTHVKLSEKIKNKIFEEVPEVPVKKETKKTGSKNKVRTYVFIGIMIIIITIAIILVNKYGEKLKKTLNIYDEYLIGEKVILKDGSVWYIVEDSNSSKDSVKLLKEKQIDINNDGVFDNNDKKSFNTKGETEYDTTDRESVAYYLEKEYKNTLSNSIGEIEEISLLTSKQFVEIRGRMGFGYEWYTENWLANNSLGSWWLDSSQNEKIYAVSTIGSYKLYKASDLNYIRPVISIKKNNIEKKG